MRFSTPRTGRCVAGFSIRGVRGPSSHRPATRSGVRDETAEALAGLGHTVERWPDWEWRAGAVCLIRVDDAGVRWAAADPRRDSYALAR
jgi:gamma-glutamyltranspeptidase